MIGLFVLAATAAVYFAKAILLPVALAFMLTLTLSPVVRFLSKRGIPTVISALAIVLTVAAMIGTGIFYLSTPMKGWIEGAPRTGLKIQEKIEVLRGSVDAAISASKQVEKMTRSDDPAIQKVVIQEPGLISLAAGNFMSMATTVATTTVLLFFLLASGRLFYEKLARILPTLTEKKRAIRIVHAVEEEVSRYLLTITVINAGLGVVIGLAMWAVGMPNPVLWGVMAALLTYIPYVGALVGLVIVTIVAIVSFDPPTTPILVAGIYFTCTTIEGQFVTPAVVGKRLEMNTVAVFMAVAGWGWLWGVPGALMAVPFLVSLRVLCEHFVGLKALGEFLAGPLPEDDSVAATAERGV